MLLSAEKIPDSKKWLSEIEVMVHEAILNLPEDVQLVVDRTPIMVKERPTHTTDVSVLAVHLDFYGGKHIEFYSEHIMQWERFLKADAVERKRLIRGVLMHELGHTLGLVEEEVPSADEL